MYEVSDILKRLNRTYDSKNPKQSFQAALRVLAGAFRERNEIYEQHEQLKDFVGFNQPFPLLDLPREIRDMIYTNALVPEQSIESIPAHVYDRANTMLPYKPPSPGLLLANKQISTEALDIMYKKNTFRFHKPGDLLAWEDKIGQENRDRVRKLHIIIRDPEPVRAFPVRFSLQSAEAAMSNPVAKWWVHAFRLSELEMVNSMVVEVDTAELYSIPLELKDWIEEMLMRSMDDCMRRVHLFGCEAEDRDKFPSHWQVDVVE